MTDLSQFRKDSPMNVEWDAWQDVVKEFQSIGIDVNAPRLDRLISAINVWGERIHALRATQDEPECGAGGPLIFHSKCHPFSATWTWINGNILTIRCSECDAVICHFVVASGPYGVMPQ